MVLLEAMSRRCVPVCFDSYSALHDIVQDHSNGLIVPAFDLPAFIAAMSDMMSNHALRDQLAEQAAKSVEKFSEIKVVKQWTALFRSLSKNDNSFAKWPPDSPNRSMNLVVDGTVVSSHLVIGTGNAKVTSPTAGVISILASNSGAGGGTPTFVYDTSEPDVTTLGLSTGDVWINCDI